MIFARLHEFALGEGTKLRLCLLLQCLVWRLGCSLQMQPGPMTAVTYIVTLRQCITSMAPLGLDL